MYIYICNIYIITYIKHKISDLRCVSTFALQTNKAGLAAPAGPHEPGIRQETLCSLWIRGQQAPVDVSCIIGCLSTESPKSASSSQLDLNRIHELLDTYPADMF